MDKKTISVIIAAISAYLWFQPFSSFGVFYQSGQHWGGVAYGLLILPILFSIASWFGQKQLSLVFSILFLLLSLKLAVGAGGNIAWGLVGIVLCSIISVYLASALNGTVLSSENVKHSFAGYIQKIPVRLKKFAISYVIIVIIFYILLLAINPDPYILRSAKIGMHAIAFISGVIAVLLPTTRKSIYIPVSVLIPFLAAVTFGLMQ